MYSFKQIESNNAEDVMLLSKKKMKLSARGVIKIEFYKITAYNSF